jgi:pimeloyl-ACP methyl ester carboxylesterase
MMRSLTIAGVSLEFDERGTGRPLLFLDAGEGLAPNRGWLDALAGRFRVILPTHPGWGRDPLPDWMRSTDDLAYLYLDLAKTLGLNGAILAGAGFGGWIAAEMAVRDTRRFARLVLAAPLGIKCGGVLDRDILDMHSVDGDTVLALSWADPRRGEIDLARQSDKELAAVARGRESLLVFGWKPYMHNPGLRRWLHRIEIPTLLIWGAADRVVTPAYGEEWRASIPEARLEIIPDAGHYPHWEQPACFAELVGAFADRP